MTYLDEVVTMHDAPPIECPSFRRNRVLTVSERISKNMYAAAYHARSCVYFVGNFRAVKIGVTQEIGRRLIELDRWYEPMHVLLLKEGSYGEERDYHERFSDYYVRKEWFKHDGKLAEYIARERVRFAV